VFISSHVPCHKFLEDVNEDSMQIPSQLAVPVQLFGQAFLRRPNALQCLEASALKTSGCQDNTVRTLGQASLISTRSCILVDTYLGSFCKTSGQLGNLFEQYPAFQNILGFLYKRGKELQRRPSGRGLFLGKITIFWKSGCRR
jgi:hypothetical protein